MRRPVLALCWALLLAGTEPALSPIHFRFAPVAARLDSCETAARHAPETMAGGVAVFDYDNDGNLDVFFTNGADIETLRKTDPRYSNRLLRNNGDGTFTDVTEKAGLEGSGYDTGVAVGDFDNDGFDDLFVAGVHRSTLYRNNGKGAFLDVTGKAGLAKPDPVYGPLWSVAAAWLDVNNDGLLDLFVVNYLRWDPAHEPSCRVEDRPEYCHPKFYREQPNQLFLNNGDGTFSDVSAAWGIRKHLGKGMGVAVADYDRDGRPDVFVANDKLFNFFFRNRGGFSFQESGFENGVALAEHGNMISGMGVDFRDLNNDGWPDLVLVALDNETFPIFLNNGKGGFYEVTTASGMTALSSPMAGYSPNIADFDNDGWKDIFVSRGHVQSPAMASRLSIDQPNTVFRNAGPSGRWAPLTVEAGFTAQPGRRHRGSAVGDFNHDGKLDIVVTALGSQAELWLNDSPGANHWLDLKLVGTRSNRSGIGAAIQVDTGEGSQFNHMTTASGYASSSATPVHFGLGTSATAKRITIRWPSGITQVLLNVTADRVIRVQEPESAAAPH